MEDKKVNTVKEEIEVYKAEDLNLSLEVKVDNETIWLTQKQMAELFQKGIPTVNEHIQNIYKERELEENSTIRKFRIVQKVGKRDTLQIKISVLS